MQCIYVSAGQRKLPRRYHLEYQDFVGFYPDFTDTYKKANRGHQERSCRSEESSVRIQHPATVRVLNRAAPNVVRNRCASARAASA